MGDHHGVVDTERLDPKADRAARRAISISLLVALLIVVGKGAAAWITGSQALFADALESVIHIVATGIAAFSVWYSQQPATRTHPYGKERIVFFSAGMEGALISVAALAIIAVSVRDIIIGPELEQLGVGLLITAVLAAVNLLLGAYLVRTGRRTGSIAVEANGQHTLTDVWTSTAVLVGVAVVWLTDIVLLDPLVAILAGLHILNTGFRLLRRSVQGLMGVVDSDATEVFLRTLQDAVADGLIDDFHALRFRTEGRTRWAEVHLLMPGELSLEEAHRRATSVESRLRSAADDAPLRVTTHLEPFAHQQAHPEGHQNAGDLVKQKSGGQKEAGRGAP